MSELKESYLSEVHSKTNDNDQKTFSDFTQNKFEDMGTKIAVVSDPTGGITEVCDEYMPELGMPENELNNFRMVRSNLDINDDIERHNKAIEKVDLENKYLSYLNSNEDARQKMRDIKNRVDNGEKITLVCFEKDPKWCHRHILIDYIESEIN